MAASKIPQIELSGKQLETIKASVIPLPSPMGSDAKKFDEFREAAESIVPHA